jgi:glycosyltransferase involved in cell wall biosynthesis
MGMSVNTNVASSEKRKEPGAPLPGPLLPEGASSVPRWRVLLINPSPVPPSENERKNMLHHLSRTCAGDLLATRWGKFRRPSGATAAQQRALGRFAYHATASTELPGLLRPLWDYLFFVTSGWRLSRVGGRYDAIITYGPYTTGLAGSTLRLLTGAPLIVDMPGNPVSSFSFLPGRIARFKQSLARRLVPLVLGQADAIKLLYPGQLDGLRIRRNGPVEIFPDFVPIRALPAAQPGQKYLLFIGHPWYLKGVDVLIRAFNRIAERFPGYTLKIVGHCPDRTPFEALRAGNPRIEFYPGMNHEACMQLMVGCSAFVLPSRTEAMGRVLIEAMAMQKPVVASRVDGIPNVVEDGVTGLLFRSEDDEDLAEKLERVLSEPDVAAALARAAHRRVWTFHREEDYVDRLEQLIERVAASTGGEQTEDRRKTRLTEHPHGKVAPSV